MNSRFKDDLLKENIVLTDEMLNSFEKYYNLLVSENEKYNLTRITSEDDVYYLHFYDSLMVTKALNLSKDGICLLDIGSGPGFPGIPLKIANSKIKLTILEATNKKVEFMKMVVHELGLNDVEIYHMRSEDFRNYKHFDYVTTRAVASILDEVPYTIPFLKIGGLFIAMKSEKRCQEELDEAKSVLSDIGAGVKNVISYDVLDRKYSLAVIEKIKPTPIKYLKGYRK